MDDNRCQPEQANSEFNRILPVPLSSIETFHFFDGHEARSNLIFGRLLFDESIDEDIARAAWKIVTSRQPLICARLTRLKGRLQWVLPADFDSTKAANNSFCFQKFDSAPLPWSAPPMDPSINPGPFLSIRTWTCSRALNLESSTKTLNRSEVWFWAHHALCDGAAAVVFINDWLQVYQNLVAEADPHHRISKINLSLLQRRNDLAICSWEFIRHLPHQIVGLFGAAKFIFRKITTIASTGSADSERMVEDGNFPAIVSEQLTEDGLLGLQGEADRLDVSLNSVLLSDLFRTLHKWLTGRSRDVSEREWLRVILPMNLREFKHREMPVANRTSIVQIDRRGFDSQSRDDLIRSIDREIKIIRRWHLDRMFLIFLKVMSVFETNLKRAARNERSRGIAVFTNLARPIRKLRDGETESLDKLQDFDFVGPIRRGTPLNFTVSQFRRGLHLTLHFDSTVFSANEATDLLHMYRQVLAASEQRESGENGDGRGFVNQN